MGGRHVRPIQKIGPLSKSPFQKRVLVLKNGMSCSRGSIKAIVRDASIMFPEGPTVT